VSAWYENTFSRDYLSLYPHRDGAEATQDIAAILQLIHPPKTLPLLDLCCGAGRHLIAFRKAGFTCLTGLDLSTDLLAEARDRLHHASMDGVQLLRGDMREIPGVDHYHTIVSLFTSFGYFKEDGEDERVLQSAYRALAPGGTLLLDTLNRGHVLSHLVPSEQKEWEGKRIDIERKVTDDGLRVEKHTHITQPGFPETTYRESVRMYQTTEIEDMLNRIGFVEHRFYGHLNGRAFSDQSPRMVFAASKVTA